MPGFRQFFIVFEIEREHQFFNFLGWILNARLKEELDIKTSKERLHKIWHDGQKNET